MEYILTNFILHVRRNFKNVTIELAIHSHSGGGYRISNFLMAKEVNKEVKKKLQNQCPTIKYYENTKYVLNRKVTKKIPQMSCVSSRK
jgi:hypothetical protein